MQDEIKSILLEIGEDPTRQGLVDTPKRVEKAWLMKGISSRALYTR